MTINWKFVQNTFSYKDFEIISILGSGGFGTCSEATFENIRVCTKQLNRTSKKKAALQSFHAETRKEFFNFDHPNVVRLLAASQPAFYDDESVSELLMVFELIQGRTLQSIIDDQDESIDLARMCRYGHEVSSALDYVHSFNIAHLDVKPANIMVSLDGVCKLADFGCSQCIEAIPNTPTKSLLTGTLAYRAPELLKGGSPSAKCDVYAVGIFLWHLWSREFPYLGMHQFAVTYQVVSAKLRPKFNKNDKEFNPIYEDLATRCWSENPSLRPDMSDVINILSKLK